MKDQAENKVACPASIYILKDIQYHDRAADWQQEEGNALSSGYSMLLFDSGDGLAVIDGNKYNLMRGKCFIASPATTMTIQAGHDGLSYYQLSFEGWRLTGPNSTCTCAMDSSEVRAAYLSASMGSGLVPCSGEVLCHPFSECMSYVEKIYEHRYATDEMESFANHARFQELLRFIFQQNLSGMNNDDIRTAVKRSIEHLQQHYQSTWTVEQLAGLAQVARWSYTRMFKDMTGLFLEDFLVALGITPAVQSFHAKWGKQDYLQLDDVPVFDIAAEGVETFSQFKPDFIMLDRGFERWISNDALGQFAPTYLLLHPGEDWRMTLRKTAELLGKTDIVDDVIAQYRAKANEARKLLKRSARSQTVACLRISALAISLYAGPQQGYTGPILYGDLGLKPPAFVEQFTNRQRNAVLPLDELQLLDSDHLFIAFDKRHSIYEGEERAILDSPTWRALEAVKNGCVYEVDFMAWMNYGVLSHHRKMNDVLNALA
ncbi:ABC transporter substrate-binding protein [Paenibacillus lentus]|uniref:ABC transporter substrate-binding protein n=1 Tax=Paenibacillus lentus TaxID=1338368 RepID=UPI00365C7AD3